MKLKHLVLLTSIIGSTAYANDPLISLQASQGSFETNDSSDGVIYSIHASLLVETPTGSFHKANLSGSYDSTSSTGSTNELLNIEYQIGTFWYPKASANDYSMWMGLGQWQFTDQSGGDKRIGKATYIPLGFEGGSIITDSQYYFIYGADIKAMASTTVELNSIRVKEASGYGYSAWLGFDYQYEDGTALELRLKTDKIKIDEASYEFTSNNLAIGYRF
jgi:hypothetical protein